MHLFENMMEPTGLLPSGDALSLPPTHVHTHVHVLTHMPPYTHHTHHTPHSFITVHGVVRMSTSLSIPGLHDIYIKKLLTQDILGQKALDPLSFMNCVFPSPFPLAIEAGQGQLLGV